MPTLEELAQGTPNQGSASDTPAKVEGMDIKDMLYRIPAQFNIGLTQALGLPKIGADLIRNIAGYKEESGLPSARDIHGWMAERGMTYEPGEEPSTTMDRFLQNVGASSLPLAGVASKTGRSVVPIFEELTASAGGAVGGKALESTDWGQENPTLARAIGELGGGLAGTAGEAGRIARFTGRVIKKPVSHTPLGLAKAPFRGKWAESRAASRLGKIDPSGKVTGQTSLTPTQELDDPKLAQLRARIEEEYPKEYTAGTEQRSEAVKSLEKEARIGEGNIENVREFIDRQFRNAASDAEKYMRRVTEVDNPITYNRAAKHKLENAYDVAREQENKIWNNLPDVKLSPNRLIDSYTEEYRNITEGGDIDEIPSIVRRKLGKINKFGKLSGGELVSPKKTQTSAKALHQFYSRLGREVRKKAEGAGNTNEIRILNNLRRSILQDLEDSAVGKNYREAIDFSRDLNEKFTTGAIGDILGFNRGQATPETQTLDDILSGTTQEARENVEQLLRANPGMEDDIKNTIKSRFALSAQNQENLKINQRTGKAFIRKHEKVLNVFPELKNELTEAVEKQSRVDQLAGVGQISEYSPLIKEKSAASLFLGSDPGDELQHVIKTGKKKGKTLDFFKDLKNEVSKDPTGKAKEGVKNAFVEEMLNYSRKTSLEDPVTGNLMPSGRKFLERLDNLERPLKESGTFSESELNRMKQIGKSLRGIETEFLGKPKEPILTGPVGRGLDWVAANLGARVGQKAAGAGMGSSIQMAGRTSSMFQNIARNITKDEAIDLLIDATKNPKTYNKLVQKIDRQNQTKLKKVSDFIINRANELSRHKPKSGAAIPAITHAEESKNISQERQNTQGVLDQLGKEKQDTKQLLNQLK